MPGLEDDFTYVLRKALIGHGLAPSDAAKRAGLPESEVLEFLRGRFSAATARRLAPVLGLNAVAFTGLPSYEPGDIAMRGIMRLDLPFGSEQVNAWLVCNAETVILFDAGHDAADLIDAVTPACGRLPDQVFITHAHHDHVGAVARLRESGIPVHAAGIANTIPMQAGDTLRCGPLTIRACDLTGHATPALGFHVGGLEWPALVLGDALFAGSMGGCKSPATYQQALRCLRDELGGLPDATVLLPGHGPATTLGDERAANPFL